jgi:hypothetical protein
MKAYGYSPAAGRLRLRDDDFGRLSENYRSQNLSKICRFPGYPTPMDALHGIMTVLSRHLTHRHGNGSVTIWLRSGEVILQSRLIPLRWVGMQGDGRGLVTQCRTAENCVCLSESWRLQLKRLSMLSPVAHPTNL